MSAAGLMRASLREDYLKVPLQRTLKRRGVSQVQRDFLSHCLAAATPLANTQCKSFGDAQCLKAR